jgi:hypothetical protein
MICRFSVVLWLLPLAVLATTLVRKSIDMSKLKQLLTSPSSGRSPTGATSESPVTIATHPWESGSSGKYQYHPGGDPNAAPKDAPSALNVVVVPNVTLPAELHEKYNKWGKDGYP